MSGTGGTGAAVVPFSPFVARGCPVPQEPPAHPIGSGCGKPSRPPSRLSIASFLLALPLCAIVAWNIVVWRSQPPPLSGFAGLGWFIGMASLFALLVIATLIIGP